jgi:hypothetical protein
LTQSDLNRLLIIKKLIEQGFKPGYLVPLSPTELVVITDSLPKADSISNLRRKVKHARTFDSLELTAKAISELKNTA